MRLSAFLPALIISLTCHAATDARIQVALTLDAPCRGVSTTTDGRIFLVYSQGSPQIVEWNNSTGTGTPYPDAAWNSYNASSPSTNSSESDLATVLVKANAQRIGPDGKLWVVDTGGSPVALPLGPKLVVVNVQTNSVERVYPMGNVTKSDSNLNDIRFGPAAGGKAYLTDSGVGVGALIVLDLASGQAARLLEGDLSVMARMPRSTQGTLGTKHTNVDDLEVSPDGVYLYYQPSSGGMSRIETRYLDQALYNSSLSSLPVLQQYVESYALTPSTGGVAIDGEGNIYVSDGDRQAIERVFPNGTRVTIVQDDRLLWVDAMWVDSSHRLWMPATKSGVAGAEAPYFVFSMDIGVGPSAIDHA